MSEKTNGCEQLRRFLPAIAETAEVDEFGDKNYRGFRGNCSQSALYVTDGHILLPVSAMDPALAIEQDEESYRRKYTTDDAIGKVWDPAEKREDIAADLIGVGDYEARPGVELAFVRDARGRVMIVNAHLLAFGIRAVHPDALTVSAARMVRWFDSPLALRREGKLVGLIMPMRIAAEDFPQYEMHGPRLSLAAAAL